MRRILAALAMLTATPAAAEWQQATTRHFTVYADDDARDVRAMADRLERFDMVMRLLHNVPAESAQAANRLTVYVVNGGQGGIQRICGGCRNVAGFYVPRASGAVAFTPKRIGGGGTFDIDPQVVLFHEYAHHFLLGNYAAAYPAWFSEGYAEFVSTVRFEDDGSALIGAPAMHRARGLMMGPPLPIEALFQPAGRKLTGEQVEKLYGRGWLMTHYLLIDPARAKLLDAYLRLLNSGTAPLAAAQQAFGDLKALDRALNAYLTQRTMNAKRLGAGVFKPVEVAVRPLGAGEAALIDLRMQSTRGVNAKTAAPIYARAAPIAARFPGDATAQGWLAEMAYDAARDVEGEAAADRALALDPRSAQALIYKGRVQLRRLAAAKSTDPKAWKDARGWIVRANRLNPDEAEPLLLYYTSFVTAGEKPIASAVAALNRAQELVPQDRSLRMLVTRQAVIDGDLPRARAALRPIAYDPHAAPDGPAMRLLQLLDRNDAAAALATMDTPAAE